MYGRTTKNQRLREIRKANDKEGRLERAALIRIQARRLEEAEGIFSQRASELYSEAARIERGK